MLIWTPLQWRRRREVGVVVIGGASERRRERDNRAASAAATASAASARDVSPPVLVQDGHPTASPMNAGFARGRGARASDSWSERHRRNQGHCHQWTAKV